VRFLSAATIEITVSSDVPCSGQHVYDMLWHCERFAEWWPFVVRTQNETTFTVQPLPMAHITMTRTEAEAPHRILYEYVGGPFRGEGEWLITDNGSKHIHVDYTIRLRPVNALVALGASTPLFRWKHRRDILGIMNRICS
jgi:uncharacterized protein YndB with AHSA1/START domain